MKVEPTNNQELLISLFSQSKFGPMAEIFVIDALMKVTEKVASMTVQEVRAMFAAEGSIGSIVSPDAWHGVATEIKQKMDSFYNRHG